MDEVNFQPCTAADAQLVGGLIVRRPSASIREKTPGLGKAAINDGRSRALASSTSLQTSMSLAVKPHWSVGRGIGL